MFSDSYIFSRWYPIGFDGWRFSDQWDPFILTFIGSEKVTSSLTHWIDDHNIRVTLPKNQDWSHFVASGGKALLEPVIRLCVVHWLAMVPRDVDATGYFKVLYAFHSPGEVSQKFWRWRRAVKDSSEIDTFDDLRTSLSLRECD